MVQQLRTAGIEVKVDPTVYPNGRFARLHDPEGNPIELWEPKDSRSRRATRRTCTRFIGPRASHCPARPVQRRGLSLMAGNGSMPFWINASLSWKTVLYTALLAVFGAAIVGILPALRVTRINVQDALRNESAARSGLRFGGFWTTVIVVQIAITVAFLPLAAGGVFESNRFRQRAEGIGAERYLTASIMVRDFGWQLPARRSNRRCIACGVSDRRGRYSCSLPRTASCCSWDSRRARCH
ncbi:MAG: hypothetical protein ACREMQ_05755 [Longimicrobiales bacterium]